MRTKQRYDQGGINRLRLAFEPSRFIRAPHLRRRALAGLLHAYIPEPQHRVETYRKLVQPTDRTALGDLARELRDRFGPLPSPVELLVLVAEFKLNAPPEA